MNNRPPFRIGFRMTLTSVLTCTVLILAAASVGLVIGLGEASGRESSTALLDQLAQSVQDHTDALFQVPVSIVDTAMTAPGVTEPISGDGLTHPLLPYLWGALASSPALYSLYLGDPSGDFLQVIHARRQAGVVQALSAPGETEWVIRAISGRASARVQTWTFLDSSYRSLGRRVETVFDYRPFTRPWFQSARPDQATVSEPYVFQSLQQSGLTASRVVGNTGRVMGADVTLVELQTFLANQKVSAHGAISLAASSGAILGQTPGVRPESGWLLRSRTLEVAGQSLTLVLRAPLDDFVAGFRFLEGAVAVGSGLLLLILVPWSLWFSGRLSQIMTRLAADVDRVCKMDFSGEALPRSRIIEFDRLITGFSTMKENLAMETSALSQKSSELEVAQLKLKKIVEAGMALSTEKDSNALCQRILDTAKDLTDADGGTLYLVSPSARELDFNILLNDTLGTRMGGTSGVPVPAGLKVALYRENGEENHNNVASHAFLTGETINVLDAYDDDRFDFRGTRVFDEANGYRSQSMLTIPLRPMGGEVLGCLQLINAKDPQTGVIHAFRPDMREFVEALAATAATAIYNKNLLENLEQLFEAIIDIINGAIGRKSPYTGGHCERVPIIATELAKVARLNDAEMREFVLAAKLHDVGKVTTPEYVVDKSTKLETIYNRIHEVRARFEIVWRDAQIARHEAVLVDPRVAARRDAELAELRKTLDDDWAFLAQCNLGGEFLTPEHRARIAKIGARTWTRTFDDRLGLSWEEEERLKNVAPIPTPAPETLLSDGPIHIFARHTAFADAYTTTEGTPYPFKTPVPAVLYNQGEVYNLSVSRGTLTDEEHFKIKEHVMQTIYMLDRLPWPKGLERVPEIAGEHHETLVGTGYPCQKSADRLSLASRILTIADIFEALTASDRPYKKPKSLSQAVTILHHFKTDRHIDAELFDLFLTSGVYLDYAKKYLRADQIDEFDIAPLLGPVETSRPA